MDYIKNIKLNFYNNNVIIAPPGLSNLEGIQHLTGLSSLFIQSNTLTSIPELSGLTNLSELYIIDANLTSLPELSGLTNLSTLEIYNNDALTKIGRAHV